MFCFKSLLLLTSIGSIFGAVINISHERDDSKSKLMNHSSGINERTERYTEIFTHGPKAREIDDTREHHVITNKLKEIFKVLQGISRMSQNEANFKRIRKALGDLIKLIFGPFSEFLVPTISGLILVAIESMA